MKTNQIMCVPLKHGAITIGHKDRMGSLNRLFDVGNVYRVKAGMPSVSISNWIKLQSTIDFVAEVESKIKTKAITREKGKYGGTSAHLYVLLDAAAYLNPSLRLEIYETFVEQRLLEERDKSGDGFIELNAQLTLSAQEVFGKPSHNGHYINLAKIIKSRVLEEGETWNNTTPDKHIKRARIEEILTVMLKNNLVRDWEHLKELAAKV